MRGKERVRVAMSGGKPDCVPFIPQICVPHAVRMLGMDFESSLLDVVRHPLKMNRLSFECAKAYGVDGLRCWIPGNPLDVVKVDGIWHGQDPVTGKVLGRVDFEGGGDILPSDEPEIETEADVDAMPVPTVDEILRSGKLDGIKEIIAEAGEDFFVISSLPAFFFEYLTCVRGKVLAMMDIIDRPEFCHYVLEKRFQIALSYAEAFKTIGIDGIMLGDTYGGVIGPEQFQEFTLDYIKRFADLYRDSGMLLYMHVCGHSSHLFERMADTGVHCIEPLDNVAGVQVHDAKARVGHRIALMGGVNTVKLARGTFDEVIEDGRRCLDEGAAGGGYILACSDMLPTETAPEKVRALVQMAHGYSYTEATV